MTALNPHYGELKDSYLFYNIAQRTAAYQAAHPGAKLYRLGIGDVSLPLCPVVIEALHKAVEEQAHKESFHGYMPECGTPFLREAVCAHYALRGVTLEADEIFITGGAGDDLGNVLDIFHADSTALVLEPAYPAYVDTNIMAGHRVLHQAAGQENGFLPLPDADCKADLIYLCSPNNPTGAAYSREKLQRWVDHANATGAVIVFDAAYEAFIEDPDVPHSIYELPGAKTCAIEICSLSKTAGFTGMRCGYTVMPKTLVRGQTLHSLWVRDRTTKSNGVSYILQRGAEAVFTPEGQRQTQQAIAVYKQNAKVLMQALDRIGLWYCGGRNAPYLWVKCPDGMGSWEGFDLLLNEAQIVCGPGEGFGACGEGYLRFSAFGDVQDTVEAAHRLEKLLG